MWNYDVMGGNEALIRINFMLGTFHQPKSGLHRKVTSAETTNCVSESILYWLLRWILLFPPMAS